jgi:AcrR family transcriptional regulator
VAFDRLGNQRSPRDVERDSAKTRERILAAVGTVLAREGFAGLGINAVAREAGVGKTLIYRYFGGLPELLHEFADAGFWPTHRELTGREPHELRAMSPEAAARAVLGGHLRELRARPVTREIMKWELLQKNELSDALARAREESGIELLAALPRAMRNARTRDLAAVGALLHAGISYLAMRSDTVNDYLGIRLDEEAGWKRIRTAIDDIVRALTQARSPQGRRRKTTKRR